MPQSQATHLATFKGQDSGLLVFENNDIPAWFQNDEPGRSHIFYTGLPQGPLKSIPADAMAQHDFARRRDANPARIPVSPSGRRYQLIIPAGEVSDRHGYARAGPGGS